MSVTAPSDIERREAAFWDRAADELTDSDLLAEGVSVRPGRAGINERFYEMMGGVRGKKVLDVGCGAGAWSVYLARHGADVYSVDISPLMVSTTSRRAALQGVTERVHASVGSATDLTFADGTFDLAIGQDIIHHLDPGKFGAELARVLKPGGRAVFRENNANNAALMWARDHLCGRFGIPKWSSDDEYPLTRERMQQFCAPFSNGRAEYPEFLCFHYLDAKIFKYKSTVVTRICRGLDRLIYRAFPPFRQFSYRQIVVCER